MATMANEIEIRRLDAGDDRTHFRSGDEALDRYFHVYAGQNQFRHHLSVTYVARHPARGILGYVTIAAGSMDVQHHPGPNKLPKYPLPVLYLGRLAVDLSARGGRIGKSLLHFVFWQALKMANEFGCVGVRVDAKPGAVKFYEDRGFIQGETIQSGVSSSPRFMFLPLSSIPRQV